MIVDSFAVYSLPNYHLMPILVAICVTCFNEPHAIPDISTLIIHDKLIAAPQINY